MEDMNAFERQVANQIRADVGPERPLDAMAIVRSVKGNHTGRSLRSLFGATRFVLAGIVVALFGGLLLAGVLTQPPDETAPAGASTPSPEATESPAFALSTELPDDVESGTIDTPAGPARWVHLSGDTATLPKLGTALPWPTGLAVFVPPNRVFKSSDGIDWQVEELSVSIEWGGSLTAESLTFDGGSYWLASSCTPPTDMDCRRLTRLWRSVDASSWEEIDLSGLGAFTPSSFQGSWGRLPAMAPPVTAGELTMSVVTSGRAIPPGVQSSAPDCDEAPVPLGEGRYRMTRDESACGPVLRFEERDTGLRLIDDATGEELGEIPRADLTHLERMSRSSDFSIQSVVRVVDDQVIPVDVPWSPYDQTQLFAVDGEMYAYVHHVDAYRADDMAVWRTADGRSWTQLGRPDFAEGTPLVPLGYTELTGVPGAVAAYPGGAPGIGWETSGGTTWSAVPESPEGTYLHRLESGWFASDGGAIGPVGDQWWMLVGETWVSLAQLGMERTGEGCTARPTAAGRTTVFTASEDDCFMDDLDTSGPVEMWLLNLDAPE